MNNSVLNQSTTAPIPAPPQLPKQAPTRTQALSTIAPASPSVAPQSLIFDLSSPVRPLGLGLLPMSARSMAINRVQQLQISSIKAAETLQEAIARIFLGVEDFEQVEIKEKTFLVKNESKDDLDEAAKGGARASVFKMLFKQKYKGKMYPKDAADIAYKYFVLEA